MRLIPHNVFESVFILEWGEQTMRKGTRQSVSLVAFALLLVLVAMCVERGEAYSLISEVDASDVKPVKTHMDPVPWLFW